ncbi:MAG: polymerase subunit sigma-24 [Clostridiaceae bacterium]|jgi:RNA polymerase sigma-70 factor (ECF subfamily)|uniref:RNA polymerase sigma factor n=1 Tax=Clostridium sp. TaxID=1506 RepID=UPI00258C1E7F|nr:sigma-70 family RNA polymerase sigma factor [Clostridium sp.]MDF2504997.1 polymerase subunit sigma-24 [Clostridium sp.]MDF2883982.1 polymerase subunit sigma-24 [Clostridiaceae bacterium]
MLIYLSLIDTEEEKNKFEQIYYQYKQLLFYVANKILNDEYLSEDAVHETFIKIAENIRNISEAICPQTKSYIVIIVRNISLNILKKQKSYLDIDEYSEIISDDYSLEDEVLSKYSFNLIVEEISNLPVTYKDVLYLTYVEGLSTKEIARLINIENEAVKKRLQRGRKILLENIRKRDK